jgi:hypothetical protein
MNFRIYTIHMNIYAVREMKVSTYIVEICNTFYGNMKNTENFDRKMLL